MRRFIIPFLACFICLGEGYYFGQNHNKAYLKLGNGSMIVNSEAQNIEIEINGDVLVLNSRMEWSKPFYKYVDAGISIKSGNSSFINDEFIMYSSAWDDLKYKFVNRPDPICVLDHGEVYKTCEEYMEAHPILKDDDK